MSAVLTESVDNILVVTLNRPEARNAWNDDLVSGLRDAWRKFAESDDRVCVVKANGPHFSAGLDVKNVPKEVFGAIPNFSTTCNKPIIVAVEAVVLGVAGLRRMRLWWCRR